MAFFNEFPNTRTYDSDLGWLIKTVKGEVDQITELQNWQNEMNQWKDSVNDELAEIPKLRSEFEEFKITVNTNFEVFTRDIENQFERLSNEINQEVDQKIDELTSEVTLAINDLYNKFDEFKIALQIDVDRRIQELANRITANNEFIKNYVATELQNFLDELPEWSADLIFVYNPVKGVTDSLQNTINSLYDICRVFGITAGEYDALGLTAGEYDALLLTAIEYDTRFKLKMNLVYSMRNPFTGLLDSYENIINALANLHKDNPLTAGEYDALGLTAGEYDAYYISAKNYDFVGKTILV